MTPQKLEIFQQVIRKAPQNSLSTNDGCKRLAKQISTYCKLWEPSVYGFLVEMKGLNLKNEDDIILLIEMANVGIY